MKTTDQIQAALDHVRSFFPEVTMVIINTQGHWSFMSSDFDTPNFEGVDIDTNILDRAVDSAYSTYTLPYVHEIITTYGNDN